MGESTRRGITLRLALSFTIFINIYHSLILFKHCFSDNAKLTQLFSNFEAKTINDLFALIIYSC